MYFSVLAVFLVFAVSFIVFQQAREKQYKIGTLTIKLENYNELLAEDLALSPGEGIILQDSIHNRNVTVAHEKLKAFVREHESKDLRASQVIEEGYADETLVAGNLDPQLFEQGTVQQVETATKALCQEVKTALCKRGLKSRYCIASGCEVPPSTTCRLENIKAVSDAVKKYGTIGD